MMTNNTFRRVSRFQVPTELPVEEYEDPKFKSGCRLNDGNVVMEGDSLLDKGNCRVNIIKILFTWSFLYWVLLFILLVSLAEKSSENVFVNNKRK